MELETRIIQWGIGVIFSAGAAAGVIKYFMASIDRRVTRIEKQMGGELPVFFQTTLGCNAQSNACRGELYKEIKDINDKLGTISTSMSVLAEKTKDY